MRDRAAPAHRAVAICVLLAPGLVSSASAGEAIHAAPAIAADGLLAQLGGDPARPLALLGPPILAIPGRFKNPGGKDNAQPHAYFDTTDNCTKCHVAGGSENQVSNKNCTQAGCHDADIGKNLEKGTGFHGRSKLVTKGACGDCHDEHRGLGFDMINDKKDKVESLVPGQRVDATPWAIAMGAANNLDAGPKSWNHDLTGYKLIGGHKIDCDKCHKPSDTRPKSKTRTFLGTDQECLKCHDNYHNFKKGDRFEDCLLCHTFFDWNKKFNLSGFNHDKETKFALNGAHERVACTGCHAKGKPFAPVPHDTCETCHAQDSVHGTTFTSKPCVYCHNEVSWKQEKVVTADHKKFAKFDADGAHSRLACAVCHKGLKTTPPKAAADEKNCTAPGCHNNIHAARWMENQPTGCLRCHSSARWTPVSVENKDHASWAKWNLLAPGDRAEAKTKGKHLDLECVRCHRDLREIPQQHECMYCHVDWHATLASVADKPGAQPASRGGCDNCHGTVEWPDAIFDHNKTNFPLTGAHALRVTCEQCHGNASKPEDYKHDTACNSCHGDPHLGRLEKRCDKCHTTEAWEEETFDHNRDSKYKLVGKHLNVDCYKCHLDLGFKGTPDRCVQCHWDYHKGAWGPIGCEQCHNERRWQVERGTLVFETLHNFGEVVLGGAHEKLECGTCHAPNPRWLMTGLGGECNQCHPDVHLGGRGQECHTCHNQTAWLPAEFNHSFTGFPLTGTHRLVPCIECHRGNVYTGTPDDCVFCHSDDAQQVHGLCDTIVVCQNCHNTVRWLTTGATPNCGGRP